MIAKAQIKFIRSLHVKKYRQKYARFIVEGNKLAKELSTSGYEIEAVYARPSWITENRQYPADIIETDEVSMKKISAMSSPTDVLAVVLMPASQPAKPSSDSWSLALDNIRDPGNLGAIIRTADWFGITRIYCSTGCVDLYNPKTIQATMGSLFRVQVSYGELETALPASGLPVLAADTGGRNLYATDLPPGGIILIGNESEGISESLSRYIHTRITIPGSGRAESLNASVAAALVCAEIVRRKMPESVL